MSATAVKREVAFYFVLAALIIIVFFWLLFLDPFNEMHGFLERFLPGFRGANFSIFGKDGQLCIVAAVILLIAIPPFPVWLVIYMRRNLEHHAFHSHLIPVRSQRSPGNNE